MRRGEIYFANLNPTIGSEINKIRPVLIISNDANNRSAMTVTIIPITSNISKIFSFEVFLPKDQSGLPKDSKLQCQQIRTIDKKRLRPSRIGYIKHPMLFDKIALALKLHLSID